MRWLRWWVERMAPPEALALERDAERARRDAEAFEPRAQSAVVLRAFEQARQSRGAAGGQSHALLSTYTDRPETGSSPAAPRGGTRNG